ncbi:MAG TPA: WbqC family protein [Thermoanaerobaculia bacterium]|nr:WbqC family protein [Thermoanaerobaculia bacterium]
MKRIAVLQSSYIPWKGYFDIIGQVDELILYDDAQFTKHDWRNRNRIKTQTGTAWLTIPVLHKGKFGQTIRETAIRDPGWALRHWKTLQTCYSRAAFFHDLAPAVRALYEQAAGERSLSRVNELFLRALCALLGIATRITQSADYELAGDRTQRLVHLCEQAGAGEYLTGPAASAYLEVERFASRGIAVEWMSYEGYPEYRQVHAPPFVHEVTVLDLLFNVGPGEAGRYMLSRRREGTA